jgi:hypothetical protein
MSDHTTTLVQRPAASGGAKTKAWRLARRAYHLGARSTHRQRVLPDFIIAGAQRSGTTSLFRYLAGHPEIVRPRLIKGVHYFDLHFDRDIGWYRTHFPKRQQLERVGAPGAGRALTGEASPYYMFHPAIPSRMAELLPGVKVIVILRDPVRRAWSQYQHEVGRGFETLSFEEALRAEPVRLEGEEERLLRDPTYVSRSHIHHSYVARGRYLPQLQRLHSALGPGSVLVLENRDLERRLQKAFDRVTDFLGLSRHELEEPVAYNTRRYAAMEPGSRRWLTDRLRESNHELFDYLGVEWDWAMH